MSERRRSLEYVDTTVAVAIVAGLSGVLGAVVGAGGTLLVDHLGAERQRSLDHDDALIAYWSAVGSYAHLFSSISSLLPRTENPLRKLAQGVQISGHVGQIVSRQWAVADAFWQASGRVRAIGSAHDLKVVDAVEQAVGDWNFGDSMPDDFAIALRQLRLLVQSLGPTGVELAGESGE